MTPEQIKQHREMVKRAMEISRNQAPNPDDLELLDQMIAEAQAKVASVPLTDPNSPQKTKSAPPEAEDPMLPAMLSLEESLQRSLKEANPDR